MNVKRASLHFSNCSVPKKKKKSTTKEVGSVIINVVLFRGRRKRPPTLSIFHKFFGVKEHKT